MRIPVLACLLGVLVVLFWAAITDARENGLGGLLIHGYARHARPNGPNFGFLDAHRDKAAMSAATSACGVVFYEQLILHPPFSRCNSTQIFAAVSEGWRDRLDGPFNVKGCAIRWYSSDEACELLEAAGTLNLVGDSLVRHLTQALLTILIGDYANATNLHPPAADYDPSRPCTCSAAYNDGHALGATPYCRGHSIVMLPWKKGGHFCPRWSVSHLNNRAMRREVRYVSGGLHFPNLTTETIIKVWGPRDDTASNLNGGVTRICGLLHAPGPNKPVAYLNTHGLNATIAWNALVAATACSARDRYFNPFTVTFNSTSIDGQHYGPVPNVLMAQLLLNTVAAITREEV